jgi:hypothetical protein
VARPRPQYTEIAAKAVDFAALFNTVFRDGLPGPVPYRIEITGPSGPSTDAGKQALQHIRLVPPDGGPAIVVGTAKEVDKSAEIRTHYYLSSVHAQRFKDAPFPIGAQEYRELVERLQRFFDSQRFRVTMVDVTPGAGSPRPQGSGSRVIGLVVALTLLAALAIAAVVALR